MRNLRNILWVLIVAVIVTGGFIAFNSVDARSTSKYSLKLPESYEYQDLTEMMQSELSQSELSQNVIADNYINEDKGCIISVIVQDIDDFDEHNKSEIEDIQNLKDYEEYLKEMSGEMFDDSEFVRIGKKNYRAARVKTKIQNNNAEMYYIISDNYCYSFTLIGNTSKIKEMRKYLNTIEIKDSFSVKGVVGVNRTLIVALICVGIILAIVIIIIVIVLIMKKRKSKDLNSANPIS